MHEHTRPGGIVAEPLQRAALQHAHAGPAEHAHSMIARPIDGEEWRPLSAGLPSARVVVTEDARIVQLRGLTDLYLDATPDVVEGDLRQLAQPYLRAPLRDAIDEAKASSQTARRTCVAGEAARTHAVALQVIPFQVAANAPRFFIVLFEDTAADPPGIAPARAPQPNPGGSPDSALIEELAFTRSQLRTAVEQAQTSNEEPRAAIEEITSNNEELQNTNDRLQIATEQLHAVNQALAIRSGEAEQLADDLRNLLNSTQVPVVLLGLGSVVRQFTPAATQQLLLTPQDVGKTVAQIPALARFELSAAVSQVLDTLIPFENVVQGESGRWFQLHVRPYLTRDRKIDGTVVTAIDITSQKQVAALVEEARNYSESIVDTVREALVVVDEEFRVRSVNRAFHAMFPDVAADIVGKSFFEVNRGHLDASLLRERLQTSSLEDFRVESPKAREDARAFVVNARQINQSSSRLIAIQDVTEKERALKAIPRMEQAFREMLMTAAEAIVMSDGSGRVAFANDVAGTLFGHAPREMLGLSVHSLIPQDDLVDRDEESTSTSNGSTAPSNTHGRIRARIRQGDRECLVEVVRGCLQTEGGPLTVHFITDVTERTLAQQRIVDYQQKLQAMAFDAALAEERERRQIAADLHDRIGQSLVLAQLKLSSQRGQLTGEARRAVDSAVELLAQTIADTRTLMFDLSPPVLYDLGLKAALAWLAEDVEKRNNLHVLLIDDEADKPLDDASAALVFRAVRELLTNVAKHAQTGNAAVSMERKEDQLQIDVLDGGIGFDQEGRANAGFGLFSVREQIKRLGGSVFVSSEPRRGTRVRLRVPLLRKAE